LENLIKQSEVNDFLSKIERLFPNFIAGIVCDHHGFPIASKIPKDFPIQENILALSAISNKIDLVHNNGYLKIKRNIDRAKNVKLLLLLEKSAKTIHLFKKLNYLIENQDLF
jgi:hypothetical protein